MQITAELLYAHLAGFEKMFSYKQIKHIDLTKLPAMSNKIYSTTPYRWQLQRFVISRYVNLANSISSCEITLHAVDLFFLGEYVRTGRFPKIDTFDTIFKFKKASEFYSLKAVQKQIMDIQKESERHNTAFAKFVKADVSVFKIRDDQTNILYDMLKEGKINLLVYSYLMNSRDTGIDFSKMKLDVFKINILSKYISNIQFNELLTM